jgi:hypothetical protein
MDHDQELLIRQYAAAEVTWHNLRERGFDDLPVSIPDAVYIEATRVRGAAGAGQIVEWINSHLDQVRIVPTEIGIDQQRRMEEGRPTRGMGDDATTVGRLRAQLKGV